ncbi:MAG: glycosyltransferase family A protein [Mucilaginibacter sp.]|uniref:glycosyltransferase family 2 protein n=1 Tax=Mucilaginibacter sp. TaxID=1882438 RepID=UPI0031AC007D
MKYEPLVSIIVPCYNHERYIVNCIESIVNQTYKNFELVVIDDGSTDNSPTILKKLQEQYKFELVIQENIGVANTLNKGIKWAKGKYVTLCASDDSWFLDKLDRQVNFMENNPDYPMCFGNVIVIDEFDNKREENTHAANVNLKGGYVFKDIMLINFHPPVNNFFRKDIFDEVGYYRPDIWTEDFYMNLRITEKHPIGYIEEYLSYYRIPIRKERDKPNIKMLNSHLECINFYKDSEYYDEAIKQWHYRNFRMFAGFKSSKRLALDGMTKNFDKLYTFGFFKSLIKLVLVWN